MGKAPKGSSSSSTTAKAGKKKTYTDPPKPNFDKRDARIAGEQQFIRGKGRKVGRLVVEDITSTVFDALTKAFEVKRIPRKPFDTGYRFDASRGRVIVPEGEFTNGY